MRRFAPALSLFLLTALSLPARADKAPAKAVTVPMELLKTKHIVVMVKINGKGPFRVIFDTGAPTTLFSNKLAKEAGLLDKNPKPPLVNLFGSMGAVKVKSLELGDAKVENSSAMVMDHPTIEALASALKQPLEGIVGFPFFSRFRLTIDYQAKQLTLVPNGYEPADAMEELMKTLMSAMRDKSGVKMVAPAGQWGLVVAEEGEEAGVTVKEVMAESAASKAGLQKGDRLLTVDGRWTDSVADVFRAASFLKPGSTAKAVIKRGGKEIELTIKPRPGL